MWLYTMAPGDRGKAGLEQRQYLAFSQFHIFEAISEGAQRN
ncbi:MAG: hypothetical protein ACR2RL_24070 [Gammaproteobacteria bacterium]